ncbi:P-loop containing nucleoside triphosphate hydrolase protein [Salix suchowensis]|nr:P-loop containing nucleoside triphosphate hydrolase protein [Salix suchowensis]
MTADAPTPSEDHSRVSYLENYLALDQFLQKEGWHSHVAGIPFKDIDVLTSQPVPVNLDPIASAVYAILSKAQVTVQSSGHLARRLLGLRPSVLVKDRVIHLHDIRDLIESLNKEIRLIMFEQLLFGLPFVSDDWTPGIIHDDPKKKSLAYSCFCDPHNIGFQQARIVVLQNILTHPQLRGRFHFLDSNGKIRWKPGPCLAYLQACEQVEMMLFAASHTSVGAPARGTEFASHLLANLAGGHIRNVFVLLQLLILMGTYNKTSHITGGASRIARVPHPETGWLWMLYISHVRPVVIEWQRAFGTLAAASRAATHLFFGLHRPVTSTDLSRALSHHTQRFLGVRINIRLWRHITTFFLNHHCPDAVEWPRVDEDILQNPAKAHLAMQPSLGWHQILGFRSRSQNKTFQIQSTPFSRFPFPRNSPPLRSTA